MKLSEINKNEMIYVNSCRWTPEFMTAEDFLNSVWYDEFIKHGNVHIFKTHPSYFDMTTPSLIAEIIRKEFADSTKEDAKTFKRVLEENIDLQAVSDAVNKAIVAIPIYEATDDEIEIDTLVGAYA